MSKKMCLFGKSDGGCDLLIERDAGNEVRILTGKKKRSLNFWYDLKALAQQAIEHIEETK